MGHGIIGHYGLPGSGKTRDIVENDIISSALEGSKIFTNVPLRMDAIFAYFPKIKRDLIYVLSAEEICQKLVERSNRGESDPGELENSKIVYDEIQKQFPSGYQKRTTQEQIWRDALINYLSWSRHDSSEFVWASQSFASVDFEIRRKTHMYVQHEDLFHLGFSSRWVARNQLPDQTTGDPRPGAGKDRTFGVDEVIFRCYKSIEKGEHKKSARLSGQIPLKLKIVFAMIVILIGLMVYLFKKNGTPFKTTSPIKTVSMKDNKNDTATKTSIAYSTGVPVSPTDICDDLDGYICMYGTCDGYKSGVPACQFIDTGSIGARLLARDIARSANGPSTTLPSVPVP